MKKLINNFAPVLLVILLIASLVLATKTLKSQTKPDCIPEIYHSDIPIGIAFADSINYPSAQAGDWIYAYTIADDGSRYVIGADIWNPEHATRGTIFSASYTETNYPGAPALISGAAYGERVYLGLCRDEVLYDLIPEEIYGPAGFTYGTVPYILAAPMSLFIITSWSVGEEITEHLYKLPYLEYIECPGFWNQQLVHDIGELDENVISLAGLKPSNAQGVAYVTIEGSGVYNGDVYKLSEEDIASGQVKIKIIAQPFDGATCTDLERVYTIKYIANNINPPPASYTRYEYMRLVRSNLQFTRQGNSINARTINQLPPFRAKIYYIKDARIHVMLYKEYGGQMDITLPLNNEAINAGRVMVMIYDINYGYSTGKFINLNK